MTAQNHAMSSSRDLLEDCSFEITSKDIGRLSEAAPFIEPGTQISVTFLPADKQPVLIEAARQLKGLGFAPVPHIAARRIESVDALGTFLYQMADQVGCDRVFIIAGDPAQPLGPFNDALSIIRSGMLEPFGIRSVGIAGYPEGHSAIDQQTCWRALHEKVVVLTELGMDCEIVTQFAFDSEPVLDWLRQVRDKGIVAPVRVGLAGPANVGTLLRFAARCGVGASAKVMAKYGLSVTRLFDTAGPDNLLEDFKNQLDPATHGKVLFHLYPFGGLKKTAAWYAARRNLTPQSSSQ